MTSPILQAAFSLTQVLDRPLMGRVFFEEVIRENLDLGRPDRVGLVFDRKVRTKGRYPTPGRFRTRVITNGVSPSLHVESALAPTDVCSTSNESATSPGAGGRLRRGELPGHRRWPTGSGPALLLIPESRLFSAAWPCSDSCPRASPMATCGSIWLPSWASGPTH